MIEELMSLAGAILMVVCILALAWWCSRMLGKSWVSAASGKNIKILEQIRVGTDKSILLVKLGGHVYLIGVSGAGIQLIAQIEDELEELKEPEKKDSGFYELMKSYAFTNRKKEGSNK